MSKQIALSIALILLGAIFSFSANSATVPPEYQENATVYFIYNPSLYHVDKYQAALLWIDEKSTCANSSPPYTQNCTFTQFTTVNNTIHYFEYTAETGNPADPPATMTGSLQEGLLDIYLCPELYPYVIETDANGDPTLCGEEGDLCSTMGILDVGGTLAEHNYASFCYRTFLGPDNNAVQCEMISATATGAEYISSNESCECTEAGGIGEVPCVYDDDPDIGAELEDYLPDTSDQVADENPTPGDDDADGSDLDDLQTANNKILQQVEDNTDEVEQKQDVGNNLLDKILDSLGAQTKLLDSINKKGSSGSVVPGTDGEEQTDQCASGSYLVGEDCVSFPGTTYPTQDSLDTTELELQISDTEDAISQAYTTMKADLDGLFTFNLTGGTCASNIKTFNLGGSSVDADFSICRFQEDFSIIGMIVIFLASIGAFYILIGGKNE